MNGSLLIYLILLPLQCFQFILDVVYLIFTILKRTCKTYNHGVTAFKQWHTTQRAPCTNNQNGVLPQFWGSNIRDLPYFKAHLHVAGLEELSRQLFLEAHDMHNAQERIEWAATWKGKYFNFLGYFFSLYCLWKIFISTINIVFDRVGKKDPVTRGMEIAVDWLGITWLDVSFWSQHISFFLVGCIVVTSIRGLLLTLTKFFYAISSSKSSNIIVLILAQIMGMYFVSSVLLMRMNMPPEYRIIISQVLGELQFNFYHRWFDVIFLVSALSSIVFLYLAHKQAPSGAANGNPYGSTDALNS
ncbi:hypothetical protein J437_LFUL006327 [Ladona fulva]|uniref:Abscisic acid G-protein coupled receptor-like domain-containing protein n=1 Tax=Ladona fulva TaxID=123851 RepID=A0A8K0K0T7_LADFU|nr:hypothetical protein J437_LFUL006327 [Ladona fulva]